jgi:hypothetical protein
MCVCGCEVILLCVCVYRCVHLKELDVCGCSKITDAGISLVINNCSQLCALNLWGLMHITGICAACEVPELTLCFITMLYDILSADSSLTTQAHNWTILWAGIIQLFVNFYLTLHCKACCTHSPTLSTSLTIYAVTGCCPRSVQYMFHCPSNITFPTQNLIQNYIYCDLYNFEHLPTIFSAAKIETVNSSPVPLYYPRSFFRSQHCNFCFCLGICFVSSVFFLLQFALESIWMEMCYCYIEILIKSPVLHTFFLLSTETYPLPQYSCSVWPTALYWDL